MPDYSEWVLKSLGIDPATAEVVTPEVTLFTIPGGVAAGQIWGKLATKWKELDGWPI